RQEACGAGRHTPRARAAPRRRRRPHAPGDTPRGTAATPSAGSSPRPRRSSAAAPHTDRRPLAVLRAPRASNRRRTVSARRPSVVVLCKESGYVRQPRSGSCHRHRAARLRASGRGARSVSVRNRPVTALMEPEFWARLASIILIDLTLAGDNALVIALAVRSLPKRQQFLGRVWGTAGAVVLRLIFIAIATWLLTIPLLQVVGGLLLVWIALRLVRQEGGGDAHVRHGTTLRE